MTVTIVDSKIDPGKAAKPTYRTAIVDGKKVRIRIIDAESKTFAADFLAGFQANIKRARAANRAVAAKA